MSVGKGEELRGKEEVKKRFFPLTQYHSNKRVIPDPDLLT